MELFLSTIVIWGRSRLYPSSAHATGQDRPGSLWPPAGRRELPQPEGVGVAGQDAVELAPGADAELGEHAAQVVCGRPRADEQPGADLGVRQAVSAQPRDLGFLRGQPITGA